MKPLAPGVCCAMANMAQAVEIKSSIVDLIKGSKVIPEKRGNVTARPRLTTFYTELAWTRKGRGSCGRRGHKDLTPASERVACRVMGRTSAAISVSIFAASRRTKNKTPVNNNSPAITYDDEVAAIATLKPCRSARKPTTIGEIPPPTSQPIVFIKPVAVPRASGRTTSKTEAKILAS